jgi:hypothetical protein
MGDAARRGHGPHSPPTSSRARRRNPPRAMRRVQLRGGARRPHARRTLCTLSVRSRAPTKQMGPSHRSSAARARLARSLRGAAAGPEAEPHGAPDVPRPAEAPADCSASAAGRDRAVRRALARPAGEPGVRRPAAAQELGPPAESGIRHPSAVQEPGLPAESGARHSGSRPESRPAAASSAAGAMAQRPGAALSPYLMAAPSAAAARLLSCHRVLAESGCSEREPGAEAFRSPGRVRISACSSRSVALPSALVEGRSSALERQREQGLREARSRAGYSWGRAAGASPPRRAPGSVPVA